MAGTPFQKESKPAKNIFWPKHAEGGIMEFKLVLDWQGESGMDLEHLLRDLCKTLNSQADIQATIPDETRGSVFDSRPDSGKSITVTFFSSGAAVALIEVLKAYAQRHKELRITVINENGASSEILPHHKGIDSAAIFWPSHH